MRIEKDVETIPIWALDHSCSEICTNHVQVSQTPVTVQVAPWEIIKS